MNMNEIIYSCKSHIKEFSAELVDLEAEHASILSEVYLEIEKVIIEGREKSVIISNTILKGVFNKKNIRFAVA